MRRSRSRRDDASVAHATAGLVRAPALVPWAGAARLPSETATRLRRSSGRPLRGRVWINCLGMALSGVSVLSGQTPAPVSYENDIAPILRSYCAGCHNDQDLEGKLSMETFAQLRKGGEDHGDPIKPGDPESSFIIRSIEGREKPRMPPKDEPRVPAAELETLKRWIAAGAPGPERDQSILRTLRVPKWEAATVAPPITAAAISLDGTRLALARAGRIEISDAAHRRRAANGHRPAWQGECRAFFRGWLASDHCHRHPWVAGDRPTPEDPRWLARPRIRRAQ